MLKVTDPKFWDYSDQCFVSYPVSDPSREELWFTSNHSHDSGSDKYPWKEVVPFASYFLPNFTH